MANLVFEGVDTIAFVELNDVPIGTTQNMFVRYVFDVKEHIKVCNLLLKCEKYSFHHRYTDCLLLTDCCTLYVMHNLFRSV